MTTPKSHQQVMERNMDESRKQFERWCKTVMTDDADICMEWGYYSNLNVRLRWEAWLESRAVIAKAINQKGERND